MFMEHGMATGQLGLVFAEFMPKLESESSVAFKRFVALYL